MQPDSQQSVSFLAYNAGMSKQRLTLSVTLAASSVVFLLMLAQAQPWRSWTTTRLPEPAVRAIVVDPYREQPALRAYGIFRDAYLQRDFPALAALADAEADSFLAYRTLLALAREPQLDISSRSHYFGRAMDLHVVDSLARASDRQLWLEYARIAEAAQHNQAAIDAYTQALPLDDAFAGIRRLEPRSLVRANIFLQSRQHRNALRELNGAAVPSIEAPAYRALGEHAQALDAYERWLLEVPGSADALNGRAWSLFYLGRNAEAQQAFAALPESQRLYGQGLLALRAGDIERAISLYRQSQMPLAMWNATELLEARGRQREAIPIYLELAAHSSRYTDQAAYRALVLAERHGDRAAAEQALEYLPAMSYLGILRGKRPSLPYSEAIGAVPNAPVLDLARQLMRVGDIEAAQGELIFALRRAEDEATVIALASELQSIGEYRQSQIAAERWMRAGSQDIRTWRLAYPRAHAAIVSREGEIRNVAPELIWAVMREESRFYPRAVSFADARGLMQFITSTWDWVAELLRETPGDPFNPNDSIRYGAFYLRHLGNRFDDDWERVVTSYNGGQGYIARLFDSETVNGNRDDFYRFIDKTETREYLHKVMLSYKMYQALYDTAATSWYAANP